MSIPISTATVHQDSALTDFASKYANSQFIADNVCPPLLVDKLSDVYYKRSRLNDATVIDDFVGPRSKIPEVSYAVTTGSYTCKGRGQDSPVPKQIAANADPALNPRQLAVMRAMQGIMLGHEKRIADLVMTSGNWAAGNTGAATAVWTDEVSGVPVTDIHTALEAIPFNGDDVSVVGVCSDLVYHALQRHPQIKDLRGGGDTKGGLLPEAEVASALGLDAIYVSKIHRNTAGQGLTASYSRLWGTTTFALVVVPKVVVSTEQMCFGLTFRCATGIEGAINGVGTREWHMANEGIGGTDHVAVELQDDEGVVQNDAGYLLTSVR